MKAFLQRYHIEDEVIAVGVSGGADSLALVLQAADELAVFGHRIVALTVNHNLRPTSAKEAFYVADILKRYGIEHHILEWNGDKPQNGIEEAARSARYRLMGEWCKENGVRVLMTAHHIQDQAETFLMRLQRGSGLDGLCCIREVSERNGLLIVRPFLHKNPEDMKAYLKSKEIDWVEDESNGDEKYLRNKIRKFLPVFSEHTGITALRIDEAVQNLQSSESFITDVVAKIMAEQVKRYFDVVQSIKYADYVCWHKEVKFRILAQLCRKEYIPRADSILKAIALMDSLPFSGITLGGKEIFVAYGQIWIVPELQAKGKSTRKKWKELLEVQVHLKDVKIPHKARLAILNNLEKENV